MFRQVRLGWLRNKEPLDLVVLNFESLKGYYTELSPRAKNIICTEGVLNWLAGHLSANPLLPLPTKLIGNTDNLSEAAKNYSLRIPQECLLDSNLTQGEKALDFLTGERPGVILGELEERFDRSIGILSTLLNPKFSEVDLFLLGKCNIAFRLFGGNYTIDLADKEIWKDCGMFALGSPSKVTTEGFQWDLEEDKLQMGGLVSIGNKPLKNILHVYTTSALLCTFTFKC